jgi:hypothetical protein
MTAGDKGYLNNDLTISEDVDRIGIQGPSDQQKFHDIDPPFSGLKRICETLRLTKPRRRFWGGRGGFGSLHSPSLSRAPVCAS